MDSQLALTSRVEDEHFWFRGFRAFITPLLQQAVNGRPEARILDCGCGTGYNLTLLARFGRPVGFDLTPTGLALARGRGLPLARASITHIPFRDASFDLLTSFDVLQIIPDDGAVLKEMARVLAPGGTAIVTAPAMAVLRGGHAAEWPEERRYSPARIRRLADEAGLRVERATYLFASLFPMMLGVRTMRRLWEPDAGGDDWEMRVPPAPVNAALTRLLQAEAALTRRTPLAPVGSSVLLVASKP
jgi:SAM-dependent methyltransferase